jgi:hypothetical protein
LCIAALYVNDQIHATRTWGRARLAAFFAAGFLTTALAFFEAGFLATFLIADSTALGRFSRAKLAAVFAAGFLATFFNTFFADALGFLKARLPRAVLPRVSFFL